jgi:hypothetical protein
MYLSTQSILKLKLHRGKGVKNSKHERLNEFPDMRVHDTVDNLKIHYA